MPCKGVCNISSPMAYSTGSAPICLFLTKKDEKDEKDEKDKKDKKDEKDKKDKKDEMDEMDKMGLLQNLNLKACLAQFQPE